MHRMCNTQHTAQAIRCVFKTNTKGMRVFFYIERQASPLKVNTIYNESVCVRSNNRIAFETPSDLTHKLPSMYVYHNIMLL